ncbi:MAG: Stealth CR1 domain-containing protein [Alistipes sp.]|nr:Stealth CR1 domain-containing protein [Alistipes sp.]
MQQIDFVILWVNGDDPEWRGEFRKARIAENADASEVRYRDWRNLDYWFRTVERFAPWVRRIHFVTWGHLPQWLNTTHPKLHVVNHPDFIPSQYLQTFNSNAIELNLHRVEGLAEHFVLFNDDMFLTRECRPEDFFSPEGLPRDIARLSIIETSPIGHIVQNDMQLINERHPKSRSVKQHFGKWFSLRYGAGNLLKTLSLMPWDHFSGLLDTHMPQPYLKSRFAEAWDLWGERLHETCMHRIRNLSDLSHWLIRYDTLVRGDFKPRGMGDCRLMTISDYTLDDICRDIAAKRWRMVCINDSDKITDFDTAAERLRAAFDAVAPEKSAYEI